MIVDDIAYKIWCTQDSSRMDQEPPPKLAVYIDLPTFHQMMMEIRGPVSSVAMELVEKRTILDCPVFKAVPCDGQITHGWKVVRWD